MTLPPLPPDRPEDASRRQNPSDDPHRWYASDDDPLADSWARTDAFGKESRRARRRTGAHPYDPDGRRFDARNRRLASLYRAMLVLFVVVAILFMLMQMLRWGPGSLLDKINQPDPDPGPAHHALTHEWPRVTRFPPISQGGAALSDGGA